MINTQIAYLNNMLVWFRSHVHIGAIVRQQEVRLIIALIGYRHTYGGVADTPTSVLCSDGNGVVGAEFAVKDGSGEQLA